MENFHVELAEMSTEIHESQLSDDSCQVSVTIAGYIARRLSKKIEWSLCTSKLVSENHNTLHNSYLKLLSRGGLTHPSQMLADFVSQAFSVSDLNCQFDIKILLRFLDQ